MTIKHICTEEGILINVNYIIMVEIVPMMDRSSGYEARIVATLDGYQVQEIKMYRTIDEARKAFADYKGFLANPDRTVFEFK